MTFDTVLGIVMGLLFGSALLPIVALGLRIAWEIITGRL